MLNHLPYYHGTIRKAIVSFGHLFSSLYIDRRLGDSVEGDVAKRIQVPIAYGPKEKWVVRLEQGQSLEHYIMVHLPRMGFEITGFTYDPSRQINKNNQIICNTVDGSKTVYSPVPYTLSLSLYIVTGTEEDAMQIVEQILPTFTPNYTLRVAMLNPMEIVSDIPINLESVTPSDSGEGSFLDPRLVTWQLNFSMKLDLYGPIQTTSVKPIYTVFANISTNPDMVPVSTTFTAHGDPETYEIIDEGWLEGF